jgi:hypothetical protein
MAAPSGGRRRSIPADERLKVWVRSGGRCVICKRYLLEGQLSGCEVTFGELAHIVGQQKTQGSPRGFHDLPVDFRDDADNLVLICDDEHDELDKRGTRDAFSVDFLRDLKRRHEEHIHHVTSFGEDRRTVPIRMIGNLYGNAVEVDRAAVASAVINSAKRFPRFALSFGDAIEIDLRSVAGEATAGPAYFQSATAIVDEVVDHRLKDGIRRDQLQHLSVFAFARLPLLVYLGSKLDDNVPTDIYQRHRLTERWEWPEEDGAVEFSMSVPDSDDSGDEAVLVLNVSGSIQLDELPPDVYHLPVFTLEAPNGRREPDVFLGPGALTAFSVACRRLLSQIEQTHKQVRLLHVFAAMPVSAGVTFGRVFDPAIHPSILMYQRTVGAFEPGLRIGTQ